MYRKENKNQSTCCETCTNEDHDNMNECNECKKWIHYKCINLPPYMICSLTKGKRKYSCQNCVDIDEISKYNKIPNKKEQHNKGETNNIVNIDIQTEITTVKKEIENLKVTQNQHLGRKKIKK